LVLTNPFLLLLNLYCLAVSVYVEQFPFVVEIDPDIFSSVEIMDIFPFLRVRYYLRITETGTADFEDERLGEAETD
jgi:hypothetical protein